MLVTYVLFFVGGSLLIGLSLFSHDGDSIGSSIDTSSFISDGLEVPDSLFAFLLSTKFWSFGLCSFGLSGLLLILTGMGSTLPSLFIMIISILTGFLIGYLAFITLKIISKRNVNSLISDDDLIGMPAVVKLPIDPERRGIVELSFNGTQLRRSAFSTSGRLSIGDEVVIISKYSNSLRVMKIEEFKH